MTDLKSQSVFRPKLLKKAFLLSSVLVSLFCWLQCFLDVYLQSLLSTSEVPRSLTLLCPGCTSRIFGFPHPSGFAIEPQFMGNLLLTPTLYSFYLLLSLPSTAEKSQKLKLSLLSTFLLTTLLLIFSRGAVYSFFVALAVLLFVSWYKFRVSIKKVLNSLALCVLSLFLCLSIQGLFSFISVEDGGFYAGVEKSLSQLSLGLLELPDKAPEPAISTKDSGPDDAPAPVFSGYVAESTNIRLDLNRSALESSVKTPVSLLFGYGLGSAGSVLFVQGKTVSKMEIVQNEYLSLLLESGLLGLGLLGLSLVLLCQLCKPKTIKTTPVTRASWIIRPASISPRSASPLFLFSLFLTFALSLNFFSGLPNALHLYLFPVILSTFLPEHESVINQKV